MKWLFDVGIGNGIETVFIPEDDRGTLCVSSQVGCALNCGFCSTGRAGFNRDLAVSEILGQLWVANRRLEEMARAGLPYRLEASTEGATPRPVTNVVMMGMGEPLNNFENVVAAMTVMLDDHAYGLSRRRVTLSTSGVVHQLRKLAARCPVALAVSLHAPDDELRSRIMPINRSYGIADLLAACKEYLAAAPRDFITFEYVLLDGVNDSPAQARALAKLLREVPCKLNLIPFNVFPEFGLRALETRGRRALPGHPRRRGVRRHGPQDEGRRHRRGLRATRRAGREPHEEAHRENPPGGGVRRPASALCAGSAASRALPGTGTMTFHQAVTLRRCPT